MATGWERIVNEIKALQRPDAFDVVRREKMARVMSFTDRPLIVYAVDMTPNPIKSQQNGSEQIISLQDKEGFDQVTRTVAAKEVDVLLHSPGGSAEATESIVELLRARFSDIRFIVPGVAKSAATMMAMSGNKILVDEVSELGPIDPQMVFAGGGNRGTVIAPAQAIVDQFAMAQKEINADPSKLPSWVPILGMYGPALLAQCDHHIKLAEELVSKWLQKYMFAEQPDAEEKAKNVAQRLNDHRYFHSHARRVGIDELKELKLDVVDLRDTPDLHSAVRDLYTAISITFENTGAVKIFENTQGDALLRLIAVQSQVPVLAQQPPSSQPAHPSKQGRYTPRKHR